MPKLFYYLSSLVLVAAAIPAGYVLLPAAMTHRDLAQSGGGDTLVQVVKKQWSLQRDATVHDIRLETRKTSDWRASNLYLEQLVRAEADSSLNISVECTTGTRRVALTKLRGIVADAPIPASSIYSLALQGKLRSGWTLSEEGGVRQFFGVRKLEGSGWSRQDATPADDASSMLAKAFPDTALDCGQTAARSGSLTKAFELPGEQRLAPSDFTSDAAPMPAGLVLISEYFGRPGAIRTVKDEQTKSTTIELDYSYEQDAAQAGAAFLRARADFSKYFSQVAHEHRRQGLKREQTRNRYAVEHGGKVELELKRGEAKTWHLVYSITMSQAEAAQLARQEAAEESPTGASSEPAVDSGSSSVERTGSSAKAVDGLK